MKMKTEVDDLVIKRKGGGSIIDQRPLFSKDGETLYIVWKHTIRAYSAKTGDFVREFEHIDNRLARILIHPDNSNIIIACSDSAELFFYNCQSGVITKKLALNQENRTVKISTFHIVRYNTARGINVCQVLISHLILNADRIRVVLFDLETGNFVKQTKIHIKSSNYYLDVIGNHGDNLIAVFHDSDLHILNPARNLVDKLHKCGKTGRLPTCISGHPEEECVATGDSTGRVVVWRNLFHTKPTTAIYHWHTLPVTEIAFSTSGGIMYTGGGECVLVKWTLANPQQKSFLPRLPAPIKHLTIAPNNIYVAVSTLDNGIVVVNPQRKLTSVIQNFTWGVTLSSKDLFPAGLLVDPRSNSLVLNSRTGHVQFYNTHTKSLQYSVNITAQNFLTQERSVIIVNTEVTRIALNHDGSWMATVEERNDKISSTEVRLKFWIHDDKEQIFKLNSSIELPHENGVNALQFQPTALIGGECTLAVTTGKDKKFKLWNLIDSSSIYKKTKHWYCHSIGDYRDLPVSDAAFSMDGSLLAIGFDATLTIWVPESCTLRCSLTHNRLPHSITRIQFGRNEACHLVVVGSTEHLAVWDVFSLQMVWSVPLKLSTLTADPKSVYMAAFTTDNNLYVFTPRFSTPVYVRKNTIDTDCSVLCASFVPHLQEKQNESFNKWQQKSQLYFLDSNQELLTLESESEESIPLDILSSDANIPKTAFGYLITSQITSTKENINLQKYEHLGSSSKSIIDEILRTPAHTMTPLSLCKKFILSLDVNQKSIASEDTNSNVVTVLADDDENALMIEAKMETSSLDEDELYRIESGVQCIEHEWTFLTSILPDQKNSK